MTVPSTWFVCGFCGRHLSIPHYAIAAGVVCPHCSNKMVPCCDSLVYCDHAKEVPQGCSCIPSCVCRVPGGMCHLVHLAAYGLGGKKVRAKGSRARADYQTSYCRSPGCVNGVPDGKELCVVHARQAADDALRDRGIVATPAHGRCACGRLNPNYPAACPHCEDARRRLLDRLEVDPGEVFD